MRVGMQWMWYYISLYSEAMSGKNRRLVTDEPVEFEKEPVEVGDFRRITDQFRGIYRRIYLKWMKAKPKDVNM